MAVFTANERDDLVLRRLIFHVVGPAEDALRILPEIDAQEFADFFLDRLRESDSGNMFRFNPDSDTLRDLQTIHRAGVQFVPRSESLTRRFQSYHTGQTSPGVFMLMHLAAGEERFFALVKYDHEEVLHYEVRNRRGDDARVVIERLRDTFVQSKQALQKCAIVRMVERGEDHDVSVVDRSTGGNRGITRYFQNFLGVSRLFDSSELTERLQSALVKTAEAHREDMPEDRARSIRRTVRESLARLDGFDEERFPAVVADVFGAQEPDSPIVQTFRDQLSRSGIGTESFEIDRDAFPDNPKRRVKTVEGIEITFPDDQRGNVDISADGRRITITTQGIEENDDIAGRRR